MFYRPREWDQRGRQGSIEVGPGASLLIVEGIGSSRRDLSEWLDGSVWVKVDEDIRDARNRARVAAGETTSSALAAWLAEEGPFLEDDRPWDRARTIVAGSTDISHDPDAHAVIRMP